MDYVFIFPVFLSSLGKGLTSLKKRLDHLLTELSCLGIEPNNEASNNVVAELSIIKGAFKESTRFPVCCFTYDANSRIGCDVNGPLKTEQFMDKCKLCQAQIKQALLKLRTD